MFLQMILFSFIWLKTSQVNPIWNFPTGQIKWNYNFEINYFDNPMHFCCGFWDMFNKTKKVY